MKNTEISKLFYNIARLLEILGENPFRVRAYERAAQNIGALSEDIETLAEQGRLLEIPGIGKDLSERIKEYLLTGKIKIYQGLKKKIPEGILALLDIPSVGPKTAKLFYEKFKIKSIPGLEAAIKSGRLKQIPGIKEKTIENIAKGIGILKKARRKLTIAQAEAVAQNFILPLEKLAEVKEVIAAGSLRRCKETVHDVDILVASTNPEKVTRVFVSVPEIADIIASGATKSSVRAKNGAQVDCRVVERRCYGASLVYFTGSKAFNIKLRKMAIRCGLKINEYGVFKKNKFVCGATEEEVFSALGLPYIEPELREDTGEIERALAGKLPHLLEPGQIKGDLHAHSEWSDGISTIREMAEAGRELGYTYIAITDHSESLKVAGGLNPAELKKKKKEIDALNGRLKGFRVLYGTEVDIDSDGKIDYKDDILRDFDIVVAAIHSGFKQSREQLTKRITRACENKYVHIIAHPTGKLWGVREPYDIDLEKVFQVARDTNTALEINAYPDRMDLDSIDCRRAKEAGVRLALGTDSHSAAGLSAMRFGVGIARRGWLGPDDLINTLGVEQLLKAIRK